jgi:hypothetical protein
MPYKNLTMRNLSSKKRKAALGLATPPEGFTPFKITTGSDGEVIAVQSRPEGPENQAFDLQLKHQHVKGISTLLDGEGNVSQQWIKTDSSAQHREQLVIDALEQHMQRYNGAAVMRPIPVSVTDTSKDIRVSFLLGDPHLGMLSWHLETGEDFDLKIAEAHMNTAIDLLVQRSPDAESCVVANLGDFFHANDDTAATPRGGNRLDVDSRFAHVTDIGYGMMRRIIDRARIKYPKVLVVNLPGNHDPAPARGLSKWLEAVYENCPEVEIVSNTNPYVFLEFGDNLHMYHHGDGAKVEQLPAIMASYDKGRPWGRCEYREIQHGHYHHLRQKEHPGVVVEGSRTLAPADYWHHHSGYRSGRGMRSIVHHRSLGRLAEHVVGVKEVELALVSAND